MATLSSAGAARNTSIAILPPAQGLFSTTTVRLSGSCSCSASARVTTSSVPPGEKPTRILAGGWLTDCAMADGAPKDAATTSARL